MFEIKALNVNLGQFFLKNIDINLEAGEYFAILGKTGTGKTVLLETIAGRHKIESGTIIRDHEDISHIPPEKRDIGFVYQNYELFPHLTVKDNIGFSLRFQKVTKKNIRTKTEEIMDMLSITHLKDRYPKDLSGGEKQRIAIGRSISKSPKLLLLDEPFSALDYVTKESVKALVKDIHQSLKPTIIHVTHDIKDAIHFADKIGILKDNTIAKVYNRKEIDALESEEDLYEYI